MTESASNPRPNSDQLDRIAALRSRQSGVAAAAKPSKRRRRHVAQGSRIIAAGLGATTMLGIVTVLGLDNAVSGADESVTPTVPVGPASTSSTSMSIAPPPVRIVIHRVPASAVPTTDATAASAAQVPADPVPAAPVQLTARPVVQTVTVAAPSQTRSSSSSSQATSSPVPAPAPAPSATTNGSR